MLAGAQLGITLCSLGLGMVAGPAIEHLLEPVFGAVGLPDSLRSPISRVVALAIHLPRTWWSARWRPSRGR